MGYQNCLDLKLYRRCWCGKALKDVQHPILYRVGKEARIAKRHWRRNTGTEHGCRLTGTMSKIPCVQALLTVSFELQSLKRSLPTSELPCTLGFLLHL